MRGLTVLSAMLLLCSYACAGTSVLGFDEFQADTRRNWQAMRYGSHLPDTPAIITEVYAKGLDVRVRVPGEEAGFQYPICVLACETYPEPKSENLVANPFTQYFRFGRDEAIGADALVAIDSFDLLSMPGTYQAPGLKVWVEDAIRKPVWGPVVVSPYGARKGRVWHMEVPSSVGADSELTLWIQDLDSHNRVNLRDGMWGIDNLKFSQVTSQQAAARKRPRSPAVRDNPLPRGALSPERFEIAHLPSRKQVVVAVSLVGLEPVPVKPRAEFSVGLPHGRKIIASGAIDSFTEKVAAGVLDIKDCRPGKYLVRARLYDGRKVIAEHSEELEVKPLPEWWDNKLGILPAGVVPEPWTSLVVKSDKDTHDISCWNRTYRYRDSVFPAAVTTAGAQILSRPIELRGVVNGRSCGVRFEGLRFTKKANDRVEFTATGSLGGVPVRAETWIEFDGFMWVKLCLEPEGTVNLSGLQLDIPVKREHATLYNSDREDDFKGIGSIDKIGESFHTRFDPIWNRAVQCWLGDEERGIHWCAESDRNWHLRDPHQGIGYVRYPEEVVVTIKFVDHEVKISEPFSLEFGLMATPNKPKPAGWRSWRFGHGNDEGNPEYGGAGKTKYGPRGSNYEIGFAYWSKYARSRYPQPHPSTAGRVKNLLDQGIKVIPDCSIVWNYPLGPEYLYFMDEWHTMPFAVPDIEKMDPKKQWLEYPICPRNKSAVDWWIWAIDRTIGDLDLHGIYFDMSSPPLCGSHWHGCGFQDPGRPWPPVNSYFPDGYGPSLPHRRLIDEIGHFHPETQILATREKYKRFYNVAKRHDPNFITVFHSSGDMYLSLNAFVTFICWGEEWRRPPADYYEKLPLDRFRAAYMCHNLGPMMVFLPEFAPSAQRAGDKNWQRWYKDTPEVRKKVRHLLGMLLLHDVKVWPAFSTFEPYDQIRDAQDEFGQWDDAMEFLPYWHNSQYLLLEPEDENLVCSVFRGKPQGADVQPRAMFVMFNNTDQDMDAAMHLNFKNLGISGTQLRDLQTAEMFPIRDGSARVNMPCRDYRMLLLE